MSWAHRADAASFLTRLRQSPGFGPVDLAAITKSTADVRTVDHHGTVVPEGRRDDRIHVVLEGWAAQARILETGSRQIPALFIPGDIANIDALHLPGADYGTVALTRCTVVSFARDELDTAMNLHRGLRDAVYRMMAVEKAIATQWTVGLGRRSARERTAHLLCELFARLHAVGAARPGGFALPLTQEELADVLGLTAVHVNRTLQALRSVGLIRLKDHVLTIPDRDSLAREGGFEAAYLHNGDGGAGRAGSRPSGAPEPARLGA